MFLGDDRTKSRDGIGDLTRVLLIRARRDADLGFERREGGVVSII